MINNSEIIKQFLSFTDKDDFYFLQIFKRRKDNPDLKKDQIVINNFYINSVDDYLEKLSFIIRLCNVENARAYIWLNKRNYKKLAPHLLSRVAVIAFTENCKSLSNTFNSIASEFHAETDKKWIVDVDYDKFVDYNKFEENPQNAAEEIINKIGFRPLIVDPQVIIDLQIKAKREPMIIQIPTKNGFHFITHPFNLKLFKEQYPKIDVHKDNPSLLYCP